MRLGGCFEREIKVTVTKLPEAVDSGKVVSFRSNPSSAVFYTDDIISATLRLYPEYSSARYKLVWKEKWKVPKYSKGEYDLNWFLFIPYSTLESVIIHYDDYASFDVYIRVPSPRDWQLVDKLEAVKIGEHDETFGPDPLLLDSLPGPSGKAHNHKSSIRDDASDAWVDWAMNERLYGEGTTPDPSGAYTVKKSTDSSIDVVESNKASPLVDQNQDDTREVRVYAADLTDDAVDNPSLIDWSSVGYNTFAKTIVEVFKGAVVTSELLHQAQGPGKLKDVNGSALEKGNYLVIQINPESTSARSLVPGSRGLLVPYYRVRMIVKPLK